MKWKRPEPGEIKIKKRFAWLPTKADDDYVYWLEFVYKHYVCKMFHGNWNDSLEWKLTKITKHA